MGRLAHLPLQKNQELGGPSGPLDLRAIMMNRIAGTPYTIFLGLGDDNGNP